MKPSRILLLFAASLLALAATAQVEASTRLVAGTTTMEPGAGLERTIALMDQPGFYCTAGRDSVVRLKAVQARTIETEPWLSGSSRTVLRLDGSAASHTITGNPSFYFRLDSATASQWSARLDSASDQGSASLVPWELVRLMQKNDGRELETMVSNCYVRRAGIAPADRIPLTHAWVAADICRLTAEQLPAGEYAWVMRESIPSTKPGLVLYEVGIQEPQTQPRP